MAKTKTTQVTEGSLMAAWLALGDAIGSHLTIVVPLAVAAGILFPKFLLPIKPFVPTLFALMTFQNSLKNDAQAIRVALRRPLVLVSIVCWVHVVAPLVTWAAASLVFGPSSPTVIGVVLEYSVPIGTTAIMWVGMFGGEMALALAALLFSAFLSPFSIPLTLKLLVGAQVAFDTVGMMSDMVYMVALPAALATLANTLTHGRSAALSRPTMPVSRLMLPVIIGCNATSLADFARHPSWRLLGIMGFMLAFALVSFGVGMLLGRRLAKGSQERFVAVSFCSALRNVSVGAVLAAQYFGPEVIFPAIIGTPFQQVLASLFGRAVARMLDRDKGHAPR